MNTPTINMDIETVGEDNYNTRVVPVVISVHEDLGVVAEWDDRIYTLEQLQILLDDMSYLRDREGR